MDGAEPCLLLGASLNIVAFGYYFYTAAKFHYDLAHETPEQKSRHEVFLEVAIFFSYVMFAVSSFYILLTILFMVGVVKKYQKLMNLWFHLTIFGIILECLLVLLGYYELLGLIIIQSCVCVMLYAIDKDRKAASNGPPEQLALNASNCGDNPAQYV